MPLTAFVARSFDPKDEERIRPILDFLESFRKAGFFWEEAQAAEVESVSQKVRGMIDERQVFVGLFTRKYPVYTLRRGIGQALSVWRGKLSPQMWSAPSWVLQESGYAIGARKKLILLVEKGVEIPGLQGDLEYIPFESTNLASVFSKLSEMINDLLARAAGREVTEVVIERQAQVQGAIEPVLPEPKAEGPTEDSAEPGIGVRFVQMSEASNKGDLDALYRAYQAGTELIAHGKTNDIDQLAWNCYYFDARFNAGAPDGLDSLRHLQLENPDRAEPRVAIARLLYKSKEYEEAAHLFMEAADLSDGGEKARNMVSAAEAFRELKQYEKGKKPIRAALEIATGEMWRDAISVLYQLLKNSGEKYFAFATAESALHQNPQLSLRFALALDYHRNDLNQLALYHFKLLHEQDGSDLASLHNLALLYSDSKLPISAVEHYKKSFEMGETLSAANLGFMYLDAGMAEQAKQVVHDAMKIEPHEGRVETCLAEIVQRTKDEEKKENELLEVATSEREFLVKMGLGLRETIVSVDGPWGFPFGVMVLRSCGGKVSGTAEIKRAEVALSFYGTGQPTESKERIDKYTLKGEMEGRVCKFDLTTSVVRHK